MALDLTINSGKGIKISDSHGGIYIRNGNLKNFSWDSLNQKYYFNRTRGTKDDYDYLLLWKDITTYNGSTIVPVFSIILTAILSELDAEF